MILKLNNGEDFEIDTDRLKESEKKKFLQFFIDGKFSIENVSFEDLDSDSQDSIRVLVYVDDNNEMMNRVAKIKKELDEC